ncbi:bystin, putative [Entamoeba invadens IP1]|uniref:Bystin n=1 Tax=Entamoeba invadens IP1 TaxID=370355 RepID=L7FJB1_ENTIV|nr:bystin, putative [Entamoeba invadens IP1]ELP84002.1 bystin, putative [Entamoeba invadens IP1]|eukprot:XP_004183348.1 bystin, putative [Entamoeba invadens IP1]
MDSNRKQRRLEGKSNKRYAKNEGHKKQRIALHAEIEEATKTHKPIKERTKDTKLTMEEEPLNEGETKKIISSAMEQLKEDKKESYFAGKQEKKVGIEDLETNDHLMEVEDKEDSSESDSEASDEELPKDKMVAYDVPIDEETKKVLLAFTDTPDDINVNSMIEKQLDLIEEEENLMKSKKMETEPSHEDHEHTCDDECHHESAPKPLPEQLNQVKGKYSDKVRDIFKELGTFLSLYRVGKLPKIFKLLPSFEEWPQFLKMTNPALWTPQSVFAATKLFVHSSPAEVEKFVQVFLYPKVRECIHKTKELHFELYMALRKTIYKPRAFFKGIIFPLCTEKNVTGKEALIISSLLRKASIPMKHSAVALYKLANMKYNSTQYLFLKTLLDKKYSLPYAALDAVAAFYARFTDSTEQLPVMWHQGLLVFVQRYGKDLKQPQVNKLIEVCKVQKHHAITQVVMIELQKKKV